MLRSPLALAALADAAVPGLRPQTVVDVPTHEGEQFQIAFVTGADGREWVVRSATTVAAGAQMEQSEGLMRLLAKRVPFAVPRLAGSIVTAERTVVGVFPRLSGEACRWRELTAGSTLARGIGRSLAALHDADPRTVEEAGLPAYDADSYRARRLATLDRAAATGLVPAMLLSRWERALEEVSLWKFATCVTHGPLEGRHVLADDDVIAITGWEHAGVSDPADDFAPLSVLATRDAFDTVIEAYAGARRDAPDAHLERRIRLAAELQRVNALLDAVGRDDDELVDRRALALDRLAHVTEGEDDLVPSDLAQRRRASTPAHEPAAPVDPGEISVVELRDAGDEDDTVEIPSRFARTDAGEAPNRHAPEPDEASDADVTQDFAPVDAPERTGATALDVSDDTQPKRDDARDEHPGGGSPGHDRS